MAQVRQCWAVIGNTVRITVGDPFFLVLHLSVTTLTALLGAIPGFTYGEHIRLLRDQCLALQFLVGQVMRLSRGKANPQVVIGLLEEKLAK